MGPPSSTDTDPGEPAGSGSARSRVGEAVVIVALGAALIGAAWWLLTPPVRRVAPARPTPVASRAIIADPYVGPKACRECHPGEYAAFTRSGHARTLRPAGQTELARRLDGHRQTDPQQPGVAWSYDLRDGRLGVTRREAGRSERREIDYALGSGLRATTLVSLVGDGRRPPGGLEHRLSYFARDDALGITPGHRRPLPPAMPHPFGLSLPPAVALDCLGCHATRTAADGPRLDPPTLIPNVTCERCHGPGRAHVEAARRGAGPEALALPFGGPEAGAPAEVRLCGHCHRLPEMVRPDLVRTENPALARFAPVGLLQTACWSGSSGGLRCTTCHDPHARASPDPARSEAACFACHPALPRGACPGPARSGCVACHMPRRDAGHGLLFTDHWIRRPDRR